MPTSAQESPRFITTERRFMGDEPIIFYHTESMIRQLITHDQLSVIPSGDLKRQPLPSDETWMGSVEGAFLPILVIAPKKLAEKGKVTLHPTSNPDKIIFEVKDKKSSFHIVQEPGGHIRHTVQDRLSSCTFASDGYIIPAFPYEFIPPPSLRYAWNDGSYDMAVVFIGCDGFLPDYENCAISTIMMCHE